MSAERFRADIDALTLEHIIHRIALLVSLVEELDQHCTLASFERVLDRTLSAHHTVYLERSFTPAQLQAIPRYLVYRYHAFGTPLDVPLSDSDCSASTGATPESVDDKED